MTGIERDDDAALLALVPLLRPEVGRRLAQFVEAGSNVQNVIEAEYRADRAEAVCDEVRRQFRAMSRREDQRETESQFVATEEPFHDNSEIIGVARSQHAARALIRDHRIARGLHDDVPLDAWYDGSASNTAEKRPAWNAEHGDTTYQILEIRHV